MSVETKIFVSPCMAGAYCAHEEKNGVVKRILFQRFVERLWRDGKDQIVSPCVDKDGFTIPSIVFFDGEAYLKWEDDWFFCDFESFKKTLEDYCEYSATHHEELNEYEWVFPGFDNLSTELKELIVQ